MTPQSIFGRRPERCPAEGYLLMARDLKICSEHLVVADAEVNGPKSIQSTLIRGERPSGRMKHLQVMVRRIRGIAC